MKYIIITFLIIHFNAFCQSENMVQIKMNRYGVSSNLESKLKEIIDRIKPKDSKLTFIINISPEGEDYLISLATTYEVDLTNDHNYVGFFNLDEKLFLIYESAPKAFFKVCGKESVSITAKKDKDSGVIVEPYIDELPNWLMRYQNGNFITVYSSY
jgi:hypothetical protein